MLDPREEDTPDSIRLESSTLSRCLLSADMTILNINLSAPKCTYQVYNVLPTLVGCSTTHIHELFVLIQLILCEKQVAGDMPFKVHASDQVFVVAEDFLVSDMT